MIRGLYIAFILLGLSLCSLAQEDSIRKLHVVEIKQAPPEFQIADLESASPTYILHPDFMNAVGATNVGDAMKYIPNVQMKDYGGIGGLKTVTYRSLGSTHTGIVLDDNIQPNTQIGAVNLSPFETFGVKSVSFITGQPNQVNAMASSYIPATVIDVQSELMKRSNEMSLKLFQNASTINAFQSGIFVKTPIRQKGFVGAQLFSRYGTGQYQYRNELNGSENSYNRLNASILNYKARIGGGYTSENSSINGVFYYNRNEQQLPGAVILYNPSNDQSLFNEDLRGDVNWEQRFDSKWTLRMNSYFQTNKTIYNDPTYLNSEGFLRSEYLQRRGGVGAMVNRLFGNTRIFFGADGFWADLLSNEFSNTPKRMGSNSVLGFKWNHSKFIVEGNLNHQYIHDLARSADSTEKTNYSKLSPYISAQWNPFNSESTRFRTFYKRVYRLPTFNDLYYNFIGNTNLKPEDAHLINAGITHQFHFKKQKNILLSFTVDAYHSRVQNKIVAIPTKDLFNWSMQNIGQSIANGLDASLSYIHKKENWKWSVALNGSYNQTVDVTDPQSASYGHQIPYTPNWSSTGAFSLGFKNWTLTSGLIYSGRRYSLNQNIPLNLLDAFIDWNLGINKSFIIKVDHELSFDLKMMNILNKNYEVIRSFPMPGRFYQLTLRYNYK